MDKFRQRLADWWKIWQGLSYLQKMMWSIGVGGSLGVGCLLWWASQPDFRVLYVGLSAEDAAAVTAKLQGKNIPFKLTANGSTILVPSDQAMQVHIDLNADGVLGNAKIGKGMDIFDAPSLNSTPFSQHINFIRAQQAELARTIMQIDPIVHARVHIVRPEPTPFIREQKPTTAAVYVKLRTGAALNRNQARGIASFVSGSVEGLARENVRIMDQNGRVLSEERDPDSGVVGSMSDAWREVEERRSASTEKMLEAVLGPGKAIVRVTAELDTRLTKKKQELYNGEALAISEKSVTNKSTTTNNAAAKGGPAGTSGGPAKGSAAGGTSSGVNTQSETSQKEFIHPKTFIEELKKPGTIERLTIAAFIDADAFSKSEPAITLDTIKDIIKKAVGFKADRDEIQVTLVKMPSPPAETNDDEAATQARMQTIVTIIRNVSIGAIALCVMPIVWMLFRRRKHAPAPAPVMTPQLLRINEELDRNPEALANILTLWIDKAEVAERKAA